MDNKTIKKANWDALHKRREQMRGFDLQREFAGSPKRADLLSLELNNLFFDYSKNLLDEKAIKLLCELAQGVSQKREILFSGGNINKSENRPALHMALRGGCDINKGDVEKTLERMRQISDNWRADDNIQDVVHIGIGGSAIGTRLICEALKHKQNGKNIHFAANIDAQDLKQTLDGLNPDKTAFIIVSKSFATPETLYCAMEAKNWSPNAPMIAVSENTNAALEFGIKNENILPLPQWVGGRYSLWSAVGLSLAIQNGFDTFEELLSGAKDMDSHFCNAPMDKNIPALLALINIWYRNIWARPSMAIIPYAHGLRSLPEYVQQIEMESGGKSVDIDGNKLHKESAGVIFGCVGTNAQHAIGQRLHQGAGFVPTDFIVVANGGDALAANAIAQSQALMNGVESDKPHKRCIGNRPSTTIIIPELNAYNLGMLLAMYEHKVFTQGAIWNINSFDQWGVELGKTLAQGVACSISNGDTAKLDASTAALVSRIRKTTNA